MRTQQWVDVEEFDQVTEAAKDGDMVGLARAVRDGDTYHKGALLLSRPALVQLRGLLMERGFRLVDLGPSWRFERIPVRWEGQGHGHGHGGADHGAAGASPEEVISRDGDDTGAMCSNCMRVVQGPPAPYCCPTRQALIEALHGDQAMRIIPCPLCHGTGKLGRLSGGGDCDRCKGTGVRL